MFQFTWFCFYALCIQTQMTPLKRSRVAPLGNHRFNGCLLLLDAYRSLPRPSSPSGTKVSTDHSDVAWSYHYKLSTQFVITLIISFSIEIAIN